MRINSTAQDQAVHELLDALRGHGKLLREVDLGEWGSIFYISFVDSLIRFLFKHKAEFPNLRSVELSPKIFTAPSPVLKAAINRLDQGLRAILNS